MGSTGYRDWVDEGGGYHGIENFAFHLEGVGLSSGNKYVANAQNNWSFSGRVPPAFLIFRLLIVVDAQGNSRVETFIDDMSCVG